MPCHSAASVWCISPVQGPSAPSSEDTTSCSQQRDLVCIAHPACSFSAANWIVQKQLGAFWTMWLHLEFQPDFFPPSFSYRVLPSWKWELQSRLHRSANLVAWSTIMSYRRWTCGISAQLGWTGVAWDGKGAVLFRKECWFLNMLLFIIRSPCDDGPNLGTSRLWV